MYPSLDLLPSLRRCWRPVSVELMHLNEGSTGLQRHAGLGADISYRSLARGLRG
jgi:hypothetical protein